MPDEGLVERLWWGRGTGPALARAALRPLELLYRAIVAGRGALYDAGILRAHPLGMPALSVGNLSVGGTGKTPVSAWIAGELLRRGARPAIVLRGYGEDEPLVHAVLNPSVPVVVDADRVLGAQRARSLGADVLVLDDAFQHRRARRDADVVLVSADRWSPEVRLLPAGPWREGPGALRRASLLLVTRKAASREQAEAARAAFARHAPGLPSAIVHLAPDALRATRGPETRPLADLAGRRVLAIAAIGDPAAFFAQLEAAGAVVTRAAFADHHRFDAEETRTLAGRGTQFDLVVCTLKDAVKLDPHWPREALPLWYVSQHVRPERGGAELAELLDRLLRARATESDPAGRASGATSADHGH